MHKSKRWNKAASVGLALMAVSVLALTLTATAIHASGGPAYKSGTIAAKGLVLGEYGKPIWAEFDAQGEVVREIGEAVDDLQDAIVMPAIDYRVYVAAFEAVEQEYSAQRRILYRDEYLSNTFSTADGSAITAPPLQNNTYSVVVRTADALYSGTVPLVLHESPLDLLRLQSIPESAGAVLLGKDRNVVTTADVNIGYVAAFYSGQGGQSDSLGQSSLGGYRRGQDTLWGPVAGAKVETSMSHFPAFSDKNGHYVAHYFIPPCPGFAFDYNNNIIVQLRYRHFDPKRRSPSGTWYEWRLGYDYCVGYSEAFFGASLVGLATKINLMGIEASMAQPINRVDFSIDVAMLTGQAVLGNSPRPGIPLDADIMGVVPLGASTEYAYTEPVFTSTQPSSLRQPDVVPDFSDQGLLKTVSKDDLESTDIYVYRVSNGQLVTSRKGLRPNESNPYYGGGAGDENDSIVNYRMLMRGPASFNYLRPVKFEDWQAATNINEELRGRKADHLRVGEQVKVIMINRATGYIGSAVGTFGENLGSGLISFSPEAILMRPPNLKVKAERRFEIESGMTAGEQRESVIGFEGSGLTSDHYITITTEWVDWDGSPLPEDLPGYTGRLAKVVLEDVLGQVAGQIANFDIRPGRHIQLVQLPGENIDNAHFYIHVNGEPTDGNPGFSEADFDTTGAGQGPLQYRPQRYVPIKVPVFNEAATLAGAYAQAQVKNQDWQSGGAVPILENIEKIYAWPYRPELQFSLFNLELEDLELLTEVSEQFGGSTTTLSFEYDLFSDLTYDPLPRFGPGRQLVFGLGYAEILALIGEDRTAEFPALEELLAMLPAQQVNILDDAIGWLQPEDYLGLQLYQSDDAGNPLVEYYGMPLLVADARPIELERVHHLSQFDSNVPGSIGNGFTESYQPVSFRLLQPAEVTLKILDGDSAEQDIIIEQTSLPAGVFNFMLDFQTVREAGVDPVLSPNFIAALEARDDDGSRVEKVHYPGRLILRTDGSMLGQIMVHDVLVQDGSLNLTRQDVSLKGRGPQLAFTRSYNNQPAPKGPKPLGEGWRHNFDLKLWPLSAEEYGPHPVPNWVPGLRGRFFRSSEIPQQQDRWTAVSVNGTVFKKYNSQWYAERGRHGTLEEIGETTFIYTAKDGTRYHYDYPKRSEGTDPVLSTDPTHMSIGDGIVTRMGVHPDALRLANSTYNYEPGIPPGQPGPTPVKRIVDRNGNAMTFSYGPGGLLDRVVDAVQREFKFTYEYVPAGWMGSGRRLTRLAGPDGIEITYTYDAQGNLERAQRATRVETYDYAPEPGSTRGYRNLVRTTDTNNHSYRYEYHEIGEVHSSLSVFIKALKSQDVIKNVIYPDGNQAHFTYDAQTDNLRTVTDLRGNDTTYFLNLYGNPRRIEEPLNKVTRMTWSIEEGLNDNVMTSRTDARDNTTYYVYDIKGNIKKETDPYGNSIETTWDLRFSQPLERTDRNGHTKSWDYDDNGNLEVFKDGDDKQVIYTYYPTGERKTSIDPRGYVTNYTYDAYGNPDTILEPEGSLTDFEHDIRGRLLSRKDPQGNTIQYAYDELDYPDKITHPDITAYPMPAGSTNVQDFSYDPEGNLLSEINRIGLIQTYTYNARNQVETVTRNSGGTKTFGYDENGNLTSETDWKGVATAHTYDVLNRRQTTINRLGHIMRMDYDAAGNLISTTDYEGNQTTHDYDKLNRKTDTWHPALEGQEAGHLVFTYYDEADEKTNLKTATDAEGNTTTFEYNGRYLRTKRINALDDGHFWEYDDSGNLAKEIDEEGNYRRYEYDKHNRLLFAYQSIDSREIKTGYLYDDNGNQTHVIDARGNTVETRYDKWNRPFLVIDADNYETKTAHDGEGNVVEVTDGNGHVRTSQRDQRGLVLAATDAEEQTTNYSYDLNGNLESVTDPRGIVTFTTYDAEDRLKTTTEAYGTARARTAEILARDKMGNPTSQKDYNGNVTTSEYNTLNLVEKVIDPFSNFTETTYYRTGKIKSVKSRRGYTTSYAYDELNREVLQTDAINQTIVTTYDKVGNVRTVEDKRNIVTESFYDDLYRLVRTDRAGLRLVTNEYDDVGNLRFITDANGNRVEQTYNNRNLLETTIYPDSDDAHPDGFTEERTYDGVGNLKTLTDEEEKVTTYNYDRENRQIYVEFAGEVVTRLYDAVGNLTSVTQPAGTCRIMAYDEFNRMVTVVDDPTAPIGDMTTLDPRCTRSDGLNLVTRYEYDDNDNRTHQYDPGDNHVEFTYDALNRKTAHIQHKQSESLLTRYPAYDEEGNLEEMVDAKGQSFTYAYDELNRQTDQYFPDTATPYLTITHIHTEYDANNNVVRITENKTMTDDTVITDVTVNNYDDFDRLDDTTQRGLVIDYEYDANGNRTRVTTDTGTTTYTFDSRNRLETAVAGLDVTTYTYTPDGQQDTVTYPNGTDVKYTYFDTNRVQTVTNKVTATAALISSYEYEYSPNGNRTRQIEVQDGISETTTYSYDAADRLIDFTVVGGVTAVTEYTYEDYNRKTERVTEDDVVVKSRTYTYDETNWVTRIDDDTDPDNIFTIDYAYDNNGNTVLKSDSSLTIQDISYTYDSRNQLVQVIRGPPDSEEILGRYDYNAQGLRVRHRFSERGDVDYYYDQTAIIEEHNAADDSLLAHYRYADRLISLNAGGSIQYYHHDARGSTVNLTTAAAVVQVSYRLDPWGHIRSQSGDSVNRQIFTGEEHDLNTGLINFGVRYYDPDIARFITQDVYLGQIGVPPSLHRYLYAYSNPLLYIDLLGYISNRQWLGIDDESVDRALRESNGSMKTVAWLTTKKTFYTLRNGVTGGFVARQDEREEAYDRGEISKSEYWTGTAIDGGVSIGSQLAGGAISSKVSGRIVGATGSQLTGAFVGEGVATGVESVIQQTGQVVTYQATDGKLGQEKFDVKQVVVSAGIGAATGGTISGVTSLARTVKNKATKPQITREPRSSSNEVSTTQVEKKVPARPASTASGAEPKLLETDAITDPRRLLEYKPQAPKKTTTFGQGRKRGVPHKPLKQGDVDQYRYFSKRPGDKIEGHEIWQSANTSAHGLGGRTGSIGGRNPSLALSEADHKVVNSIQAEMIPSPRSLTPIENIKMNAAVLREAQRRGVKITDQQIKNATKRAVRFYQRMKAEGLLE